MRSSKGQSVRSGQEEKDSGKVWRPVGKTSCHREVSDERMQTVFAKTL